MERGSSGRSAGPTGTTPANRTVQLLRRLVKCVVTDQAHVQQSPEVAQRAISYAVRIVGSRLAGGGGTGAHNELAVLEALKRHVGGGGGGGGGAGGSSGAAYPGLAVAEAHQRLMAASASAGTLRNRAELLTLLLQLAGSGGRNTGGATTGDAAGPSVLMGSVDSMGLGRSSLHDSARSSVDGATAAWRSGGWEGDVYSSLNNNVAGAAAPSTGPSSADGRPPRSSSAAADASSAAPLPPKALALQEFAQVERTSFEVSEAALVRDVVYCCQGVDGTYIKYSAAADAYLVDADVGVPRTARDLVRRLCELGWLFRRLSAFLAAAAKATSSTLNASAAMRVPPATSLVVGSGVGALAQAFCGALQQELVDFYRLMAVLEAQLHVPRPSAAPPLPSSSNGDDRGGGGGGGGHLSLRRLAVWLAEPTQRMRLLMLLAESTQGRKGGGLAAALHQFAAHGDPLTRQVAMRLAGAVCVPLFHALRKWLFLGELDDPHHELFIIADPSCMDEDLWWARYRVTDRLVPPFIAAETAAAVLRVGKSIHFLRACCKDAKWETLSAAARAVADARGGLEYADGSSVALDGTIREAAAAVDAHLLRVMVDQFQLMEHCSALKRYLLLGQGDFIQALLSLVGSDLGERAGLVSSFKLAGALEAALRASAAAAEDPAVLARLRVKLLPHAAGERGWDVFSLEYRVDMPLSTVFTPTTMEKYLRIFNFLWRLKRVEYALSASWQTMKPNTMALLEKRLGAPGRALAVELRRCQTLRNEMNHFVTNLQYYMMLEVLEGSWALLESGTSQAASMDEFIAAHALYLDTILQRALLEERSAELASKLVAIFELCLRFKGFADRLCEAGHDLAARTAAALRRAEAGGQWGSGPEGGNALDQGFMKDMSVNLQAIASAYSQSLHQFLQLLPLQKHVDLSFLQFRLDFSAFYSTPAAAGGSQRL